MTHSHDIETGFQFKPKFDSNGLIAAIVSEDGSGEPLMVAYMNAEAISLSQATGEAHFFSRSRQEIWHKGATSGNVLTIVEMRVDCDQDAIWITATLNGHGAACHTGRKSCFYRRITQDGSLEFVGDDPKFDPNDVYA